MNAERPRVSGPVRARFVWEAIFDAPHPVTINEICEITGLKRTPYLRDILDFLTLRGFLDSKFEVQPNGYAARIFWTVADPAAPPELPLT